MPTIINEQAIKEFLNQSDQKAYYDKLSPPEQKQLLSSVKEKFHALNDVHDVFIAHDQWDKAKKIEPQIKILKDAIECIKPTPDQTIRAISQAILTAPESMRKQIYDGLSDHEKTEVLKQLEKFRDEAKSTKGFKSDTKALDSIQQTIDIIKYEEPTPGMKLK